MAKVGPREHCRPLFKKYKILMVIDLHILESVLFIKQNPNLFNDSTHSYDTRHKQNIKTVQTRKAIVHKNVINNIIKIFNNIPKNISNLPKTKIKIALKEYLIEKCHYSLHEFFDIA